MIEAQKAAQAKKLAGGSNESQGTGGNSDGNVAPESTPAVVAPAPAKLKFGIKKPGGNNGDAAPKPAAGTPAGNSNESRPVDTDRIVGDVVAGGAALSLDDIADTTVEGLDQSDRGAFAFDDEIPAIAPTRDLPDELDESMKAFVSQLDSIYEIVHDPDLFGQMIRTIMQELQENPDYTKLMADQDVHTMLRGLRQSMGLAKVKKAEKSTKTRASSKKAPAASQMLSTAEELFNAEDF